MSAKKGEELKRIAACGYCGRRRTVRPTPFMADSARMCSECWEETRKEYAAANDEHIGDF